MLRALEADLTPCKLVPYQAVGSLFDSETNVNTTGHNYCFSNTKRERKYIGLLDVCIISCFSQS